jgi:GT2 family glycosyltransferase
VVTIIVVNYNGERLIRNCLQAIVNQSYHDFEVVVVDNGSSDDSLLVIDDFLRETNGSYPIRVVPLRKNIGFSGGNKEGLKYASREFIALLNNDTEPDRNWLHELMTAMVADKTLGVCASKLISASSRTIDSAGDGYSTALRGFKRGEGEPAEKLGRKEYVFGACAGAALYRGAMFEEIGFFDDDFFLIHEDTDLNVRAKLAGWRTLFVPTAIVYHKVTSSIGYMSDMQVYYTLRNSELVRMKNIPFPVFLTCLPAFLLGLFSEFLFFAIKHGRVSLFFKSKRDAIRLMPKMMEKRRGIIARKRISNKALLHEMTPVWEKGFLKAKLRKLLRG